MYHIICITDQMDQTKYKFPNASIIFIIHYVKSYCVWVTIIVCCNIN